MRIATVGLAFVLLVLTATAQFEREWYTFYTTDQAVPTIPCKVVIHPGGGYYVVARSSYSGIWYGYSLTRVLCYNANGDLLWQRSQADWAIYDSLIPVDAACTAEGNLVIGCDFPLSQDSYDTAVLAISPEGNLLWYRRDGSGADERMLQVAIGPNGNIYLGRLVRLWGVALLCYSPTGTLLWQANPSTMNRVQSISFAPDGTAFAAGAYRYGYDEYPTVVAFEPNGTIRWEYRMTQRIGLSAILYDASTNWVHVVSLGQDNSLYLRFTGQGTLLLTLPFGGLGDTFAQETPLLSYLYPFGSDQIVAGRSRANRVVLISNEGTVQEPPRFSFIYYLIAPAPNNQWVFGIPGEVRSLDGRWWTQNWVWTIPFDNSIPWSLVTTPDGKTSVLIGIATPSYPYQLYRSAFGILSPSGAQLALQRIDDLPGGLEMPRKITAYRNSLYLGVDGLRTDRLVKYESEPQPLWEIEFGQLMDFAVDTTGEIYTAEQQDSNTAIISKYTPEGQPLWSTTVSTPAERQKLMLSPSGEVVVLCSSGSGSLRRGRIVRLSSSGQILNSEAIPSNKEALLASFAPDGEFYVILDDDASGSGFELRIYDSMFQLAHSIPFESFDDRGYWFGSPDVNLSVTQDAVFISAPRPSSSRYDLVKLDRLGNLIFRRQIDPTRIGSFRSFVMRDSQGRYYLSSSSGDVGILTCFDETGTVLWDFRQSGRRFIGAVVREHANQVIVACWVRRNTGAGIAGPPWNDTRILVLNRSDGTFQFEQNDSPPEALNTYTSKIALARGWLWSATGVLRAITGADVLVSRYRLDTQPGDVNGNGCVDDTDLLAILFAFGARGSDLEEDLNSDGIVDDADLLEVLFAFGQGCG